MRELIALVQMHPTEFSENSVASSILIHKQSTEENTWVKANMDVIQSGHNGYP